MNRELLKTLVKDYDLPIMFYDEPYWSHFKELYNPFYNIDEKIQLMNKTLQTVPLSEFGGLYRKVSEAVIQDILNNPAYLEFNNCKLDDKLVLPPKGFSQAQKLYTGEYSQDQIICSIDLVKANFAVLKNFNPEIVKNTTSYEEFFSLFSDSKYLQMSKKIRQVIFGNLNPKRQQTLQRYYMSWVKHYLTEQGLSENEILLASSDELVFKVTNLDQANTMVTKAFAQTETLCLTNDYRTSFFKIKKIHPKYEYYVKEYVNSEKRDFKNIPSQHLAQAVRFYLNQPIQILDRKFLVDGLVATYDEPLFK